MKKTELLQMSWREAEEAFKKTDVAIVPVGASHGHGPAPVGVDTYTVDVMAKQVGEKTGVLVAPTLPYGYTEFNKDYAGAINISRSTYVDFIMDICRSLNDFGIKKLIFFNGHGGNLDSLIEAGHKLREERGMLTSIFEWWKVIEWIVPERLEERFGVGRRQIELAFAAGIVGKEMVDFEKALKRGAWTKKIFGERIIPVRRGSFKFKNAEITIPLRDRDVAAEESEVLDIPPEKLEEAGKKVLETLVDYMVEFTEEFKKVPIPESFK